jgi:putative endonuclease
MVKAGRQALGKRGEAAAREYLEHRGMRILLQNFACAAGEVDLIGRQRDTLVFIEVKTRTSDAYGPPQLGVHLQKQRQIVRAAQWYLAEQRMHDVPCRFDVVAVTVSGEESAPEIEWVQNAFPAEGERVW